MNNFQLKVHSKYTAADFDEDMRAVLRRAGCRNEKMCFIMDESNMLDTGFLERLNTLLANGEVDRSQRKGNAGGDCRCLDCSRETSTRPSCRRSKKERRDRASCSTVTTNSTSGSLDRYEHFEFLIRIIHKWMHSWSHTQIYFCHIIKKRLCAFPSCHNIKLSVCRCLTRWASM